MRILLIDPESRHLEALKPLVGWGHRVWVCATEADAHNKIKQSDIDLVMANSDAPGWAKRLGKDGTPPAPMAVLGGRPGNSGFALPETPGTDDLHRFVREAAPQVEPLPFIRESAMVICDNDDELLGDIVEVFLGDAPVQLDKIRKGFAENDLEQVQKAAHSIKGASANIAAESLRDAAQHLEWAGKKRNLAEARAHFAEVQYQWHRLKTWLARHGTGPQ